VGGADLWRLSSKQVVGTIGEIKKPSAFFWIALVGSLSLLNHSLDTIPVGTPLRSGARGRSEFLATNPQACLRGDVVEMEANQQSLITLERRLSCNAEPTSKVGYSPESAIAR
jgi:hypothetical protein